MRKFVVLVALVTLVGCSKSKTAAPDASPSPKQVTGASIAAAILQPGEAPGETAHDPAKSGSRTITEFWLDDADLIAALTAAGYADGVKNYFDVGAQKRASKKVEELDGGVLYASSSAALFTDAAAAASALAAMKAAMVKAFDVPGNTVNEVAAGVGDAGFGLNVYLERFKNTNAQRVWVKGRAIYTIVVVGTKAVEDVAPLLAATVNGRA